MFKIAFAPQYILNLPPGHRFPMEKYGLLHGQLIHEGTAEETDFFKPEYADEKTVLRIHQKEYFEKLRTLSLSRNEIRASGFPLSQELVDRELMIAGGTVRAVDYAFKEGVAANIAGGTHHAYADRGEGFCLLNDIAIAARHATDRLGIKRILVVDLDVHQGNGTAKIFQNDERVFTFSMHGAGNYPIHKEKSDLDIPLKDGTSDAEYLRILREHLPQLLKKVNPQLIFYQCGVDVLKSDKLGRLALTIRGCKNRDDLVFESAYQAEIPIVFSMGGGYSENVATIVETHANTYRVAKDIYC